MNLPAPDPAFHWTSEPWGHALRCRPLDAHAQHLFTSRQLALPSPAAWLDALSSVGATSDRLMRVKQVHGNVVRVLRKGQLPGDTSEQRPDGDAIVSNQPGLALAVMVADCVPIVLVDPVRGAAAAIHAGWRGTCGRIVPTAISRMGEEFGTRPGDLIAAIGPSAGPEDYEVGESLMTAFVDAGHSPAQVARWFTHRRGTLHLDLWTATADQLNDAGVEAGQIFVSRLSTISHPDIFDSYRVAGERAGRMAAIVVVPQAPSPR